MILDFVTVTVDIFLTPPSFGHLPYILLCKTQRRRGYLILLLSLFFNPSVFLTPSPYGHSPYISSKTPRNVTGHGREREEYSILLLLLVLLFLPCVLQCKI